MKDELPVRFLTGAFRTARQVMSGSPDMAPTWERWHPAGFSKAAACGSTIHAVPGQASAYSPATPVQTYF